MELKVLFFASLREKTGQGTVRVAWREGMTCRDVKFFLKNTFASAAPILECSLLTVNGAYAGDQVMLKPEDEVAVLPPVSGG